MQISLSIICLFALLNLFHLGEDAIEQNGVKYTKKQVLKDAIKIARSLKKLGLVSGDKIAILTPNCYEGIVYNIAANAIGVSTVFLNYADSVKSLAGTINFHGDIRFLVVRSDDMPRAVRIKLTCSELVVVKLGIIDADRAMQLTPNSNVSIWPTILKNAFSNKSRVFLQTSGSSGKSKDLPFSNRNIFAALKYCSKSVDIKIRDKVFRSCLCIMPYRLPYGWGMIFVNLIGGQKVILATGAGADDTKNYYLCRPDVIYGTPTILRGMMDNTPEFADLSSVKVFFSGGFSVPDKWYKEGIEFFKNHGAADIQICNNYGFGEGLCIGTSSKDLPFMPNSVGRFFVGPEWRIVNECTLEKVSLGETGEIVVHADSICDGYYKNPEATKKAFVTLDGKSFFRTRDLAYQDGHGNVFFKERAMRFYLPVGAPEKVYCSTISKLLDDLAFIGENVVVPVDGVSGVVYAVLRKNLAKNVDYEELTHEYLRSNLLPYQVPTKVVFVDEIPYSSSGKVDYVKLQNLN